MFTEDFIDTLADRIAAKVRPVLSSSTSTVQGRLLTVRDAASYIGRSEQAVQHLIFQRDLPVIRVGRRVHLDRRDLDAWIDNSKT